MSRESIHPIQLGEAPAGSVIEWQGDRYEVLHHDNELAFTTIRKEGHVKGKELCQSTTVGLVRGVRAEAGRYDGEGAISPKHYQILDGQAETLDLIKDRLSPEAFKGYLEGNLIKYLMRHRHKNGLEDLKKAQKYLGWLVEEAERG